MNEEIAWAAGLFEGEGSIVASGGWIKLQLKMCDLETVDRFEEIVDKGRVYGPYANRTGEKDGYQRRDYYMWATRVGEAYGVLNMFWPWLSPTRKMRALELGFYPRKELIDQVSY